MSKTTEPTVDVISLKLSKRARPSKALARNMLRPDLTRAYVAQPNGHKELFATDSYVLVRIPVNDEVPEGPIAPAALKRIEKGETHEFTGAGSVKFSDADGTPIEYHAPEQCGLPFANVLGEWDSENFTVVSIAITPELLKNLADAMGAQKVRLDVMVTDNHKAARKPIRVTGLDGVKGEGLLMPVDLR